MPRFRLWAQVVSLVLAVGAAWVLTAGAEWRPGVLFMWRGECVVGLCVHLFCSPVGVHGTLYMLEPLLAGIQFLARGASLGVSAFGGWSAACVALAGLRLCFHDVC